MSKLKKLLASLLAVAMLASVGTGVMAEDVGATQDLRNMTLAGSYTETVDDQTITKELWIPNTSASRGFADTKQVAVIHKIGPSTQRDAIVITSYVSFQSQLGQEAVRVGATSYNASPRINNLWYARDVDRYSESKRNDVNPIFGDMYAEYKLAYLYTSPLETYDSGTLTATCTVNGAIEEDSGFKSASVNQVVVDGMTITF